jgi:hypothetical protein
MHCQLQVRCLHIAAVLHMLVLQLCWRSCILLLLLHLLTDAAGPSIATTNGVLLPADAMAAQCFNQLHTCFLLSCLAVVHQQLLAV